MLTWHCKSFGTVPVHWACYGAVPVAIVSPHPEGWALLVLHESEAGLDVKLTLEEAQAAAVERIRVCLKSVPRVEGEEPEPQKPPPVRRTHEVDLMDCANQSIPIVKSMLQTARDKGWRPLFAIGSLVYYEREVEPG